jgi:hypothetical protein
MKIYTSGCSFTHSTNSWAHCDDVRNLAIDHNNYLQDARFEEENKHYPDRPATAEQFSKLGNKVPNATYTNLSSGGSSPAFQVDKFLNEIQTHGKPDVLLFQVSGLTRKVCVLDRLLPDNIIEEIKTQVEMFGGKTYIHYGMYLNIKHLYQEQLQSKELRQEIHSNVKDILKLTPSEVIDENLTALKHLVTYCKTNKIKLGMFEGWSEGSVGEGADWDFSDYAKEIRKEIQQHYISSHSIMGYAKRTLPQNQWHDLPTSDHPSSLAHLLFWNSQIHPWIIKETYK